MYLATYTGTCASLTLDQSVPPSTTSSNVIYYDIPASNTNSFLYLRVGTTEGGNFDFKIRSYPAIL